MKHVDDKIPAYLADELSDDERRVVTDHLATCPACARQAEQARRLWDQLGEVALPERMPASSSWPAIQARTLGRAADPRLFGAGWWSKTGITMTALAAGVALAMLLPADKSPDRQVATGAEETWGSSFWLADATESSFSALWLAAADQEDAR